MAIRWDFREKVGTCQIEQNGVEYTFSLYEGNAFLIFLYEWKNEEGEGMYSMHNFFADETHMKNMLGLTKEYKGDNTLNRDGERLKQITIYTDKYHYTKKLVNALVSAFDKLNIILAKSTV